MAAPANKNIKDLNGKWLILHSDIHLTDTKIPEGNASAGEVLHIDIDQIATGGMKGTSEHRALDWMYRPHSDWLFGDLQGRSRLSTLEAVLKEAKEEGGVKEKDAEFLAEGWLPETRDGEVVESWVDNDGKKWTGWQIWGFSDVNGERWLTRRFAIRRKDKDEVVRVRLVYEWVGELDS
ncbi:hypothetical protein N0V90_012605 [Kalmusia sp. IMI 367209]|nr:hypothetical protein N0V90_012605 [Kalmusia sp. IMI 367209]